MFEKGSPAQVQSEYEKYNRSADWELKNMKKALEMMPILNTAEDDARLQAVKLIMKERRKGIYHNDHPDPFRKFKF